MTTLTIYGTGTFINSGIAFEGQTIVATVPNSESDTLRGAFFLWTVGGETFSTGTTSSFTPSEADVGKPVTVTAVALDNTGQPTVRITGANNVTVVNVNDLPIGTVRVKGDATAAGNTLHAVSSITDEDGMGPLTWQWKADGRIIPGATGADFTMTQAEADKTISVTANYIDGHRHADSLASDASTSPHTDDSGRATITGTFAAGQALHAQVQDADGTGTVYYLWEVADNAGNWTRVADATAQDFNLGADLPAAVRVLTNYADTYGNVDAQVVATGSAQADNLFGSTYNETILAGAGNDTIHYSYGIDRIDGGAGTDTFVSPYTHEGIMVARSDFEPGSWTTWTMTGESRS